ncbi:hypothetical protein GLOTRDRAFT_11691, partial [Gloeophyllum trabeum ATCC 11539]
LRIPPVWLKRYPSVFGDGVSRSLGSERFVVSLARRACLSWIFIAALSEAAYDAARDPECFLNRWVYCSSRVLRQGDEVGFDHNGELVSHVEYTTPFRYRLIMAEPIMQGYAEEGATQVILLRPSSLADGLSNGHATLYDLGSEDPTPTASVNGSTENLEIDERFLASSLIDGGSSFYHASNGERNSSNSDGSPESQGLTLLARPLLHTISRASDDYTIYVHTNDLCRLGLLVGDWATASSHATENKRVVRICVDDKVKCRPGTLAASPVLLRNIVRVSSHAHPSELCIRLAPLGYARPTIPVADEVTIARVASPITIHRAFQPLVLRSLKDYFGDNARLVLEGDIIVMTVSTNDLSGLEQETSATESAEEDEPWTHPRGLHHATHSDEIIFFVVTKIRCSGTSTGQAAQTASSYITGDGTLGCWVDSSVTKMVQAGIEHVRVPDIAGYIGVGKLGFGLLDPPPLRPPAQPQTQLVKISDKLYSLSSVAFAAHTKNYDLHLSVLLKGKRGCGKVFTVRRVARHLGIHLLEVNCFDILGDSDVKTEGALRAQFDKAASCAPCVLVLRNTDAFSLATQSEPEKETPLASALRECIDEMHEKWDATGYPILVYGTTANPDRMPTSLLSCFKHVVDFEAPDESTRLELIDSLATQLPYSPDVSLSDIAKNTAAFVTNDIAHLLTSSRSFVIQRIREEKFSSAMPEILLWLAGWQVSARDLDNAITKARAAYSDSIGTPKIPNVTWDDVGGLVSVKAEILETIQLPLERPDLFAGGLKKRSGILLYGPPGTGKTLLAKAVATSCSLNFFSVKGPELLNMYIGESEANVRRVFQQARDAKPCVIFFDELDSVAPKRGNHGDSGGVMDRIVSQLLAELDGISGEGSADLFVIGATNRPDLLDSALLRPGRFDRLIYLGVSTTHEAQLDIIKALTRKFKLHPTLDLRSVANQCPFTYTGADFYALCSDAMLNAMSRKAGELDDKLGALTAACSPPLSNHPYPLTPQYYLAEMATLEDVEVVVMQEDFEQALRALIPSVSQSEMDHYHRVQSRFSK